MVSDQPNGRPDHEPDRTPEIRLHPERPPVMRLSRKVIISLATVAALAISGALIWALKQSRNPTSGGELYNTETKPVPDALASLPRDYAAIPKPSPPPVPPGVPPLGPPLPGDLGRPMLSAGVPPSEAFSSADPIQQKLAQEQEGARTSKLFATVNVTQRPITSANLPASTSDESAGSLSGRTDASPLDGDWVQNMQDRKLAFVNAAVDRKTVSPDRLANPASRYVVQAGAVIPAALITGIRSDLPGQVTAQVTEHIYDSPTGKYLLIPQGSKLIGVYDSQIAFGQDRILLVWTRLIFRMDVQSSSNASRGLTRKALLGLKMKSIIIGDGSQPPQRSRHCSASALNSARPMPKTICCRRFGAAPRPASIRPVSRSYDETSTSSQRSPSGPVSPCGSSSIAILFSLPTGFNAPISWRVLSWRN